MWVTTAGGRLNERAAAARGRLWAVVLAVLSLTLFGAGPQAHAADVGAQLTNVTFSVQNSPVTVTQGWGQSVCFNFGARVPDSASAGDTWTIALPAQWDANGNATGALFGWPSTVPDASGNVTLTIANGVATFTLTAQGADTANLTFGSYFCGQLLQEVQVGTYPLTAYLSGTAHPGGSMTVAPQPTGNVNQSPYKTFYFRNADECRTNPAKCLVVAFATGVGDRGQVTVEDVAGDNFRFTCDYAWPSGSWVKIKTYLPDGTYTFTEALERLVSLTCSSTKFTVVMDTAGLTDRQELFFDAMSVDATAPGGLGLVAYTNGSTWTIDGGTIERWSQVESTWAGVWTNGDGVLLIKRDIAGRDANDAASAVAVPSGSTTLEFQIVNTGSTALRNIALTDVVTQGGGTLGTISCTAPDGSTIALPWSGPLPSHESMLCQAELTGLVGDHSDTATVTATGNGQISDIDPWFAVGPKPSVVSIGDYVWWDVDRDGRQDADEAPVVGVTVQLYAADGVTLVDTTSTDASGRYSFLGLTPGASYVVEFVRPAGAQFTTRDAVADSSDSDADEVSGRVPVTAPGSGSNLASDGKVFADDPSVDAGLVKLNLSLTKAMTSSGPYFAGSTVTFSLIPHNDGPVTALPGWSVTEVLPAGLSLLSMSGEGYDCQTSAATCTAGVALPAGADGGAVTVTAVISEGVTGPLRNVAYVAPAPGEVAETVPLVVPTSGSDTVASATDNDAQAEISVTPLVSVGDYVWFDTDRDGIQDKGEAPVGGVVVSLHDATGSLVATTTTDGDGRYVFTDLHAGATYTIEFARPAGASFTTALGGTDPAVDSDADPVTGKVTFTTPTHGDNSAMDPDDPTIDAGLVTYNLSLVKTLGTTGAVQVGDQVSFTLVPHNEGPVDALAGWSVTEVLPTGLTMVSMSGDGYACSSAACVSSLPLAAGSDGAAITVVVSVSSTGDLRNTAYVDKAAADVAEVNPLGTAPTTTTDSAATSTDNDAQATLVVTAGSLPHTGTESIRTLLIGLGLLASGMLLLAARRRSQRKRC